MHLDPLCLAPCASPSECPEHSSLLPASVPGTCSPPGLTVWHKPQHVWGAAHSELGVVPGMPMTYGCRVPTEHKYCTKACVCPLG